MVTKVCPENKSVTDGSHLQHEKCDQFKDRVRRLIDGEGSEIALARKVGVAPSTLAKWKNGESEPTLSNLKALADAGDVNLLWLATGEGARKRTPPPPEPPPEAVRRIVKLYREFPSKVASSPLNRTLFVSFWNNRTHRLCKEPTPEQLPPDLVALFPAIDEDQLARWEKAVADHSRFEKEEASRQAFANKHGLADAAPAAYLPAHSHLKGDDFALVPRFDVEASAGHGAVVGGETEGQRMAFRRDWLAERGLEAAKLAAITAKGDSMEPTIPAGALLLLDLRAADLGAALPDGIYVLHVDGLLSVKRLQRVPDGSWLVISDNPLYKEWPVRAAGLRIVGRVVWLGHELRG